VWIQSRRPHRWSPRRWSGDQASRPASWPVGSSWRVCSLARLRPRCRRGPNAAAHFSGAEGKQINWFPHRSSCQRARSATRGRRTMDRCNNSSVAGPTNERASERASKRAKGSGKFPQSWINNRGLRRKPADNWLPPFGLSCGHLLLLLLALLGGRGAGKRSGSTLAGSSSASSLRPLIMFISAKGKRARQLRAGSAPTWPSNGCGRPAHRPSELGRKLARGEFFSTWAQARIPTQRMN